jgi:hypothetical protein
MTLSSQEKKDKVTRLAQQIMEMAQKVYNNYGAVKDDLVTSMEEARKHLQSVISGMRW